MASRATIGGDELVLRPAAKAYTAAAVAAATATTFAWAHEQDADSTLLGERCERCTVCRPATRKAAAHAVRNSRGGARLQSPHV